MLTGSTFALIAAAAVLPGTYIELCMPMAVADLDEDAELGSSWTEDAEDGDGEDWELLPKLLAMYRWRELLRFGIGMLLRLFRDGDVDSGDVWDTSIVICGGCLFAARSGH